MHMHQNLVEVYFIMLLHHIRCVMRMHAVDLRGHFSLSSCTENSAFFFGQILRVSFFKVADAIKQANLAC